MLLHDPVSRSVRFAITVAALSCVLLAQKAEEPAVPRIIVDSARYNPGNRNDWAELTNKVHSLGAVCKAAFRTTSATTVGEAMGGRVKTIRAVRFAPLPWRTPRSAKAALSELRDTLRKVWTSKIGDSSCFQNWSEPTQWSIEAEVDFEDGSHGILITDGSWHVALQAHDGKSWFLRLPPSNPM